MMETHLDQTLAEATQRLKGDHEAEVRTYDEIHVHILEMADALSDGIFASSRRSSSNAPRTRARRPQVGRARAR